MKLTEKMEGTQPNIGQSATQKKDTSVVLLSNKQATPLQDPFIPAPLGNNAVENVVPLKLKDGTHILPPSIQEAFAPLTSSKRSILPSWLKTLTRKLGSNIYNDKESDTLEAFIAFPTPPHLQQQIIKVPFGHRTLQKILRDQQKTSVKTYTSLNPTRHSYLHRAISEIEKCEFEKRTGPFFPWECILIPQEGTGHPSSPFP